MGSSRFLSSPYVLTEKRIALWTKQGRGQGSGDDYRPWLETRNVKSRGRKVRLRANLHDRTMHLMSTLERNAVLHFERRPDVIEIREQFPLERDVTREIARAMGIEHPTDPRSGCQIVMTTDLLVTFRRADGAEVVRPLSIKPAKELLTRRTADKLELERRYWVRMGFRPDQLLDNLLRTNAYFEALRSVRAWFRVDGVDGLTADAWRQRGLRLMAALQASSRHTLGELIQDVERAGGFGPGEVLSTLKHLLAHRLVDFDPRLGVPTPACPLSRFSLEERVWRVAA